MRIWVILLLLVLAGSGAAAWWFIYKPAAITETSVDRFIPDSSTMVIENTTVAELRNALADSNGILLGFKALEALRPGLNLLNATSLSDAELMVCYGADSASLRLIISGTKEQLKAFRSTSGIPTEGSEPMALEYLNAEIQFPSATMAVISSGTLTGEQATMENRAFQAARKTLSDAKDLSILLRPSSMLAKWSQNWTGTLQTLTRQILQHEEWVAFDLSIEEKALWLNGVGLGNSGEAMPLMNTDILRYVPGNTSLAYVRSVPKQAEVQVGMMFCPNDILGAAQEEDLYLLIKGIDWAGLSAEESEEDGTRILTMNFSEIAPFIDSMQASEGEIHFARFADVGIGHPSRERLKEVIQHFRADDRLVHLKHMESALAKLSDASSTLIVRPRLLSSDFESVSSERLPQLQLITLQSFNDIPDQRFYNVGMLHHLKTDKQVATEWTLEMDTLVAAGPWLFKNHVTGASEFVLQDATAQLYLVDGEGRLLWKRKLEGPIVGNLQMVDAFNNRKNQLLVSTPGTVYLIDRNGKDVEGFPISRDNGGAAAFVSYSPEKQRLLIPSGNKLLNLTNEASPVKGWKAEAFDTAISETPRLVSFGSKDYLIIMTADGNMHFLDPSGKQRAASVEFAATVNPEFWKGESFKTSRMISYDSLGNIHTTTLEGTSEANNVLPLGSHVRLQTMELDGRQYYALLDGDRYLTLNSDFEVELDYTLPEPCDQLQYLSYEGKRCVRASSSNTGRTYIFLPKTGLVQDMPVRGVGRTLIASTDPEAGPKILVCDGRMLLCYKAVLSAL